MWNPSLPQFLTRYLLQQILAASRASEESCSSSSDTRWTERGNSSTPAFFLPRSKILILGSGTPRLNREGELVDTSLLPTKVKDPDLGVRDTTVEPTLGVGLVLAVTIAFCRTPAHLA